MLYILPSLTSPKVGILNKTSMILLPSPCSLNLTNTIPIFSGGSVGEIKVKIV